MNHGECLQAIPTEADFARRGHHRPQRQAIGPMGRRREASSKTSDLDAARMMAAELEKEVALRQRGIIDAKTDRYSKDAQRPLAEHAADFRDGLAVKGNTADYVHLVFVHVTRIAALCHAERITDLTPSAVQAAIGALRQTGRSLRTCNAHLRSIKSFSRWLWRDGRSPDEPLAPLAGFNEQTDRRRQRRDLAPDELVRLIEAARNGAAILGLSGPVRSTLYALAAGTGFRASELASLTPESFELDADPATVSVQAGHSKRRRDDVQEIRPDLAELLRPWLAG